MTSTLPKCEQSGENGRVDVERDIFQEFYEKTLEPQIQWKGIFCADQRVLTRGHVPVTLLGSTLLETSFNHKQHRSYQVLCNCVLRPTSKSVMRYTVTFLFG